ncbi:hypothetical protein ACSNOH_01135 [Streptomyces sp. URMC 127]|uniref:hypothetical protein n=1 Tax=Streptomyces sp. URMC 127 TaxID=3423402 RepID=UPI003F1BB102
MTDELIATAQRSWSFSTISTPRRRVAEVVHQPGPDTYSDLVRDALAAGFAWGREAMPVVTTAVHVAGGCFHALTLTGPGTLVAPEEPVPLSSAWLKAALDTLEAVVIVVPPGTFDDDMPEQADRTDHPDACAAHRTSLNAVRTGGRLLWAAARLRLDHPPVDAPPAGTSPA